MKDILNKLRLFIEGEEKITILEKKGTRKAKNIIFVLARAVFLFSLCLILLYPLLIMVSIAFREPMEMYDPTVVWIPKTFTLESFIKAFDALNFSKILLETAKVTIISTALQLLPCMMAGYGMARFNFKLKPLFFGLLIFSIIVPPQVVSIPLMMQFREFDFLWLGRLVELVTPFSGTVSLSNTNWTYYIPAIFGNGIKSGLFIFIFIQFFRNHPKELQEAAAIDGCGRFKTFWRIMVPMSGPVIITVVLFSLVWYWNDSYFSVIHYDKFNLISSVLQNVQSNLAAAATERNEAALIPQTQAAALMSITPVLLLYVVLQKYFTEGISRTGIVG